MRLDLRPIEIRQGPITLKLMGFMKFVGIWQCDCRYLEIERPIDTMGLLWEGHCHLSGSRKVRGGSDIPLYITTTIWNSTVEEDKPAAETTTFRKNN
jgi:hypothetical protein